MNRENLRLLTFDDKSIDFLLYNWEKYRTKPNILAKKCKVSVQIIEQAIEILSNEEFIPLTEEEILKINEYVKENPETDDYEEIAVMCDIGYTARVRKYLENRELSEKQKSLISDKFLAGVMPEEIGIMLKINLHKVEKCIAEIKEYMTSYRPHQEELTYIYDLQFKNITAILLELQPRKILINEYRKVFTSSYKEVIQNLRESITPRDLFTQLISVAFYCLKCNLPFKELTSIFSSISYEKMAVKLSTQDIFHLIFQQSDPFLRAICIEHYSFSNPIPFYFPILKDYSGYQQAIPEFDICKELWFSVTPFRALISFGLGRAGWNQIGKSSLLNLIFGTDFENGSSKGNLFHAGSIDLQIMKNLFVNKLDKEQVDAIKWAYFDCNGPTDLEVVTFLCGNLKVLIIQILESDYQDKFEEISTDLANLSLKDKHVFLFIRDCKDHDVSETSDNGYTLIRIPNLTYNEVNTELVSKKLKEIGHQILEINICEEDKLNGHLVEKFLGDLDNPKYGELIENMKKVEKIMDYIKSHGSKEKISFDFLSYYPHFAKLMGLKHSVIYETDQDKIDELNKEISKLSDKLKRSKPCDIINLFNQLLGDKNASLLLCKLSQELSLYSTAFNTTIKLEGVDNVKGQNDSYTVDILWRELLLSGKYSDNDSKLEYNEMFGRNLSKQVQCGEPFELIDGDNLVFFSKEIDNLLRDFYKDQDELIKEYNRKNDIKINAAPIVLSIIGPQNSGKSLLLNHAFGCKFLTNSVRCTRGVYGSLLKLDSPINKSDSLLILDTEGLDAIERGNIKDASKINFNRTMVLFCLSISQAVIINIKGDIGMEMQNLLQTCAYSLNKLKVNRTVTPKIFFALNQMADPDSLKYVDEINLLIEKLNEITEDPEVIIASNLIEVTKENLFIFPSAFDCQEINNLSGRLFDFNVTKLSPTMNFANICADLKKSIFRHIETISLTGESSFSNISEWIDVAGTIWEVIIKYQDIVKYNNLQEIRCTEKVHDIIREIIDQHIVKNGNSFQQKIDELLFRSHSIENLLNDPFLLDYIILY